MDIPFKKYTIGKSAHHTFSFAREVAHNFSLPVGQVLGLVGSKGLDKLEPLYYEVSKADCKNRISLFLYRASQLHTKKRVRQLKLKMRK